MAILPKNPLQPNELDGGAALYAAGATALCKLKGERDTEFVKRIVCAYVNAQRLFLELPDDHTIRN